MQSSAAVRGLYYRDKRLKAEKKDDTGIAAALWAIAVELAEGNARQESSKFSEAREKHRGRLVRAIELRDELLDLIAQVIERDAPDSKKIELISEAVTGLVATAAGTPGKIEP